MTPKELSTRLSARAARWHDALDSHAALLIKNLLEDGQEEYIQVVIDHFGEITEGK